MQRWQEVFSKHTIFSQMDILRRVLTIDQEDLDKDALIEITRFSKVIKVFDKVLGEIDPDLAPTDLLNALANQIQSYGAINTAQGIISNNSINLPIIQQLNDQINPALGHLYQISAIKSPTRSSTEDLEAATNSFETFARQSSDAMARLKNSVKKTIDASDSAQADILSARSDINSTKEAFEATSEEWRTQIQEATEKQEFSFSEAQEGHRKRFQIFLEEREEKLNEIASDLKKSLDKNARDMTAAAKNSLDAIIVDSKKKHTEIVKLYNLVGRDSVTGGHKGIADREYRSAFWWRLSTMFFVLATIAWVAYNIFFVTPITQPSDLFWIATIRTITLGTLLISLAVYSSNQSTLHRITERRMRHYSLQLQAFDPFISLLPASVQNQLKVEMTKRIFVSDKMEDDSAAIENSRYEGLEKSVDILAKGKEAIKG